MFTLINRLRFYNFISGVLYQQQTDPFCGKCKAFENTAAWIRDGLVELEGRVAAETEPVSTEMLSLMGGVRNRLDGLTVPAGASGQKKAGRCKMPEGVCLIKLSKAIYDKI